MTAWTIGQMTANNQAVIHTHNDDEMNRGKWGKMCCATGIVLYCMHSWVLFHWNVAFTSPRQTGMTKIFIKITRKTKKIDMRSPCQLRLCDCGEIPRKSKHRHRITREITRKSKNRHKITMPELRLLTILSRHTSAFTSFLK